MSRIHLTSRRRYERSQRGEGKKLSLCALQIRGQFSIYLRIASLHKHHHCLACETCPYNFMCFVFYYLCYIFNLVRGHRLVSFRNSDSFLRTVLNLFLLLLLLAAAAPPPPSLAQTLTGSASSRNPPPPPHLHLLLRPGCSPASEEEEDQVSRPPAKWRRGPT